LGCVRVARGCVRWTGESGGVLLRCVPRCVVMGDVCVGSFALGCVLVGLVGVR
jgi:hypothetical protein